jgi:uncharacterized repeat protein (TIGR03809 family)
MTQRHAPLRGRELIERWCALAERRLDYLTDLFETGRWRRFHTEADFLDNIREAKAAVETWRGLAIQEAAKNNHPVNWSWLDRPEGIPAYRGSVLHEEPRPRAMLAAELSSASVPSPALQPALAPAELRAPSIAPAPLAASRTVQAKTADMDWQRALDPLVLRDRYPMLRVAV